MTTFTERTVAPSGTNKYYIRTTYGGLNKCILIDSTTGSVIPNCTGYAYGRFMECAKVKTCDLPTSDAGTWYSSTIYQKGQIPRLGAVACWKGGTEGRGHVAVVEAVEGTNVTVSESGYYSKIRFQRRQMEPPFNFNGLTFQGFIYNPFLDNGTGKMVIPEGPFESEINGMKVIGYGQRQGQKLGMISADGPYPMTALQDIKKIDSPMALIYASMNANYFQMNKDQADPYGTHYGTEISFTNHFTPHQGNVVAYGVKHDGMSVGATDNEFYWTAVDLQFACAPAYIAYLRGQKVSLWSSAFRNTKNNPTTQSMLIRTADRFALAVCTGNVSIADAVKWAEDIDGLMDLCFMDSGGSSQLLVGEEAKVYTGRQIPNVLALYYPKDGAVPAPSEPDEPKEDPADYYSPGDDTIKELTKRVAILEDKLERITKILSE